MVFELFQKLHLQIYETNSWHHKLFHFYLSFWNWKMWKRRGKITKIGISREQKSFLDEIKNIFRSFWRAVICWKNKILIKKIGDTSVNENVSKSWFIVWSFFLLRLLCIWINLYTHAQNRVWAGAPSCYLELLDKLQKQIYKTFSPLVFAFLGPLAHCWNVASFSLFCSSQLA